jgi:hypothetical protein
MAAPSANRRYHIHEWNHTLKQQFLKIGITQTKRRTARALLITLLVAAGMSVLAACGQQSSQNDPTKVVERYLDAKKNNDFSAWKSTLWAAHKDGQAFTPSFEKPGDLGVLSLSVSKVAVSDEETRRIQKMYSGSDLAQKNGWTNPYIAENMIAVSAQYTVDYDNTKVPYPGGALSQYFYLVRDAQNTDWLIWDFGSPSS